MKICPYCAAENRPDAKLCYACGKALLYEPPSLFDETSDQGEQPAPTITNPDPTQPLRVRRQTGDTQPGRVPTQHPSNRQERPGWDEREISLWDDPHQAASRNTQPNYSGPGTPPGQRGTQPYIPQPVQPVAPLFPPGSIPARKRDTSRIWKIVAGILIFILVCAAAFAVYTLGVSVVNGVKSTANQLATEAAGLVPDLPDILPSPTPEAGVLITPTLWPTFTPLPQPTAEAQATEAAESTPVPGPDLTKYLTVECAAALNHLRAANQKFNDNPTSPFDKDWRDDLSQAVSEMKAYCSSIDSASPVPGQIGEAHRNLNLATESFDNASRLLKEGVEQLKLGKIAEAATQLVQAGKYLGQALAELDKIGE